MNDTPCPGSTGAGHTKKEVSNMKKERTPLTNSNFGLMGWTLVIFYFFALFMDVGISADGAQIVIPAISEATGWNPSPCFTLTLSPDMWR